MLALVQASTFYKVVTTQELQFIPLAELPGSWNRVEVFDTPPQNL